MPLVAGPRHKNKSHAIPRSRSDFSYIGLTPHERRRTTDFSHLLPQFYWDSTSGYTRLEDPRVTNLKEESTAECPVPVMAKMCRSHTGGNIPSFASSHLTESGDVVRSQSMRSLSRIAEASPKLHNSRKLSDTSTNPIQLRTVSNYTLFPPVDEEDCQRLRNFSVTTKGVVNWGDSFRSRSIPCMRTCQRSFSAREISSSVKNEDVAPSASSCSTTAADATTPRYKVMVVGAVEVGKTSLVQQFMTSEFICSFESNNDDSDEVAVTVILNGVESEMVFVDCCSLEDWDEKEEQPDSWFEKRGVFSENSQSGSDVDAYLIVYSVTNRRSFLLAESLLAYVQKVFPNDAVILVGNKTDLVRVRAVTYSEGRNLANERGCKFIETSVAINHQVDELLVGLLSQIRMKRTKKLEEDKKTATASCRWSYTEYPLAKAKALIKRLLKKACFQSKSCDNLQCL